VGGGRRTGGPGGQAQFIKGLHPRRRQAGHRLVVVVDAQEHRPTPALAELAAHGHISQRTLVRTFRDVTGVSVPDWIIRERVNRAKGLVENQ
jgi:AraC family transcriptional activator FtrA